jgi:hypothetical protein
MLGGTVSNLREHSHVWHSRESAEGGLICKILTLSIPISIQYSVIQHFVNFFALKHAPFIFQYLDCFRQPFVAA